jgi:TM2 domain-containing membrane protein YozV
MTSEQDYWADPRQADRADGSSYWQGSLRADELPRYEQSGSVSQRARQAYAAEALRQKDHVSAGLLAVFLGMFGVHKFYLGCNQAGFIMLAVSIIGGILTFGLAAAVIWLIAIIEGIIYLSKSQTEFDQLYVLNQRDWF